MSRILLIAMLSACLVLPGTSSARQPEVVNGTASHPAVAVARSMLGKPYRYGGDSPQRGFDCSGLIHYAFGQVGIYTPRTTLSLYRNSFTVEPDALREGDLLFFSIEGKISHVGLYVGDKTFVHAPSSGKKVSYASIETPYWRERLVKAGRLF